MPKAAICPTGNRIMDTSGTSASKTMANSKKGVEAMKTKKAVHRADGTAQVKLHKTAYPKADSLSTLKSEIGILLLCLQFPVGREPSQIGWTLFERLLRRYVSSRISQSIFQGRSGCAERTNCRQRVVG